MRPFCFSVATAALLILPATLQAQPQPDRFIIEIENTGQPGMPVCVPLSIPEKYAKLTDCNVKDGDHIGMGWLTQPGIATEGIPAKDKGLVRRDLHFRLPQGEGKTITVEINLQKSFVGPPIVEGVFKWKTKPNEYADLYFNDVPVLRYVHKAYDPSTTDSRDKTYKVFHHLYDRAGKRFVTNGGNVNDPLPKNAKDLLYPHHRGLMYAFNKITFEGTKTCDTWHAKPGDTHQSHEGFLVTEAGSIVGARHRVAVDWHGPKKEVFAKEEREITVHNLLPLAKLHGVLVEFASRLRTAGGKVKLDGDPQHAGFQFRAHNDVHEQKNDKLTYYLRPDGKGKPGETRNWDPKTKKGPVNLPWDACSFVIDGKRYTVVYMNHQTNLGESRWSERDYGRFGCYFEYELTEQNPLVVNYRIWLQEGEMTVDQCEALHKAFTAPPKVTVK
jgi:hypothetical protein